MLRDAVDPDDAMRVYQLAENVVREGYHNGCDDVLGGDRHQPLGDDPGLDHQGDGQALDTPRGDGHVPASIGP